ncbi:hypothetical protein DL89DRAFT_143329 [Linderina pennispora]|uniref:Uncharacterized protein n=1 Tax=Linderina pennispora TaxID=61395 RepID=A0A1Y1WCQ1_9FUNG|nr:uncharacterized protein DL89DRAFT_143329 [Linderina pennispora]ORX70924.1 hypothetical protein DL89DRAFT_143329 [Linderina pennispora]
MLYRCLVSQFHYSTISEWRLGIPLVYMDLLGIGHLLCLSDSRAGRVKGLAWPYFGCTLLSCPARFLPQAKWQFLDAIWMHIVVLFWLARGKRVPGVKQRQIRQFAQNVCTVSLFSSPVEFFPSLCLAFHCLSPIDVAE